MRDKLSLGEGAMSRTRSLFFKNSLMSLLRIYHKPETEFLRD
jgi:hypothetical protein